MPDIRPLTLAARGLVSEYFHTYPPEISEHTFTNLFIWQPSRPVLYAEIGGSLRASGWHHQYPGGFLFFPGRHYRGCPHSR
jgi:hypothetical protein